ncbi:MAG: hypothetical protein ABFE07_10350 [Armatimonadia bacterium]
MLLFLRSVPGTDLLYAIGPVLSGVVLGGLAGGVLALLLSLRATVAEVPEDECDDAAGGM